MSVRFRRGHMAVVDGDLQLVERLAGVADLEGQILARLGEGGLGGSTADGHAVYLGSRLQSVEILKGLAVSACGLARPGIGNAVDGDGVTRLEVTRQVGRSASSGDSLAIHFTSDAACIDSHRGAVLHGAVQQLDAVEVGGVGDAVDLALELVDLLLELIAVGAVLIGAVGGLLGQLVHAVEHVVDLGEGALGGLHQGDTVLGVVLGLVQAGDLGAHLLGNGQTRGVVAGPVDLIAGRQLLQVLGQGAGVVGVVAVGVHRHDVVLNTHSDFSFIFDIPGRFLPSGPQGWIVLFRQGPGLVPVLFES